MNALLEIETDRNSLRQQPGAVRRLLRHSPGRVATLLGRNGMGKSTTVRSLPGLTRSRAGTLRFQSERIESLAPIAARMGLAVVPEGRQIFPKLSVQRTCAPSAPTATPAASPGRSSACTTCSRA